MKKALAAFCFVALVAALPAIGYRSAFVEAGLQAEALRAAALEESAMGEGGFNKDIDDFPSVTPITATPSQQAAYEQARRLQLAIPSLNPVQDASTQLIYGMMDVIFRRFRQQLFISAISQWKDELLDSDFRHLVPNLSKLLRSTDTANFLSSYDLWRSAINKDLAETPLGVLTFTLKSMEDNPALSAEERSLLTEMAHLMDDVYTFRNVGTLDEFILVSTADETQQSELFRLIGIVAKNMLDADGNFVLSELKEQVRDPLWMELYIDYVQADIDDLYLNGDGFQLSSENFRYYLDSCKTVEAFFRQLEPPAQTLSAGQTQAEDEDWNLGGEMLATADYIKLYLSTCDKLIVQWSNLTTGENLRWNEYYRLYTQYRFQLTDIAQMVQDKRYNELLNTMVVTASNAAEAKGYLPLSYSRFLNLISTVALTGDAKEADYGDIMDAVLEPVGSYSYKRSAQFTVALNSYPGLGGGLEALELDTAEAKGVGGLACPIGLELNWGRSILGTRGLLLSALDLGAVASYRFTSGDSLGSGSPQIGWKQLVSPGLYLLLQQQKHPITLGLGAQITPSLRKVSESGAKTEKNAFRLGAFLSVDIPLLTLYVKHRWLRASDAAAFE